MKVLKLVALSIICVFAFCSCQKNYSKLALGKWRMDTDASYFTKNNKRHYANDYYRGKKTGTYEMIFLDGTVEIYISGERGDDTSIYEEKKTAKCHFDKDYIYIDGDAGHILKLNNKRLVIEGKDNGELTHMEFFRIEDNAFKSFLANIWYSLPLWLWIIIGVLIAISVLGGWGDGGEWLLLIIIVCTLIVAIIFQWGNIWIGLISMAGIILFWEVIMD